MESFEARQVQLQAQASKFEEWVNRYGKVGLGKEYYHGRFQQGFKDGELDEENKLMREYLPEMHDDGYVVLGDNKVAISKNLRRDHHKFLMTQDVAYGPFGFSVRMGSGKLIFEHNNDEWVKADLACVMKLLRIKDTDILSWENKGVWITLQRELEMCDSPSTKNDKVIRKIKVRDIDMDVFNMSIGNIIRKEMSRFICFCLESMFTRVDDRDHIKHKIVTQRIFYLPPDTSNRITIINNFRESMKSLNHKDYRIISNRNQLDVWNNSRKLIMDSHNYASFSCRTLHYSHKKFLCPIETPQDIHAGLHVHMSCLAVVSPYRRTQVKYKVRDHINSKGRTRMFYNGYYVGQTHTSEQDLLRCMKDVDEYCSVYYVDSPKSVMGIYVSDYEGRILRYAYTESGSYFLCPNMHDPSDEITHPSLYLGFSASLIPLLHHDAGARGVFMAKMMNQILPEHGDFPKHLYNQEDAILSTLTTKALGMSRSGINVVVKWAYCDGFNTEDATVVSSNLIERCRGTVRRIHSMKVEAHEYLLPGDYVTDMYESNGTILQDNMVVKDQILASKVKFNVDGTSVRTYLRAIIDKPSKVLRTWLSNGEIHVETEYNFNLRIGDKMVSQHGQKTIVSRILPGIEEDIVVSPLCIPSRMTLGQIFEGIATDWAMTHNRRVIMPAFTDEISLLLGDRRIDDIIPKRGYWTCHNRYYILGQRVEEKVRARGESTESNVNPYTSQPQKGRKVGGGLRFGVMEADVMKVHGSMKTLEYLMTKHSDEIQCFMCNQCESYCHIPVCPVCNVSCEKRMVSKSKINEYNIRRMMVKI